MMFTWQESYWQTVRRPDPTRFADKPLKDMQNLAAKLTEEADVIVLFVSNADHKVVLAQGGKSSLACGAFFKQYLADYRGKGGGATSWHRLVLPPGRRPWRFTILRRSH